MRALSSGTRDSLRAYLTDSEKPLHGWLFTGQGALPFLKDGKVASAADFAEGNRVFGERSPDFALWFN